MIQTRRPGWPALAGLAAGAALVAVLAVAVPASGLPGGLQAALGAPASSSPPPTVDVAPARDRVPVLPSLTVPTPSRITTTTTVPPAPTTTPPPSTPPTTPQSAAPPPTTTEPPEPTTEDPPPGAGAGFAAAVVVATNAHRSDAGCDPLDDDARLTAAAQGHSEDMAENDYFSHTSLDGRDFSDRISAEGHPSPGGENIARGQADAAEVVAAWMDSPGHRRNILDCSFTSIGVGFDGRGNYWTQDFGR